MRFNTEEEMNNYFPDGVPNNVLGIVDNPAGNNVLYTSSNNQIVTGEEEGGYITAPEDLARIAALEEGKADKTELVGLASETWVENKNYLTEHQSLNGYATEAYVSAAIEEIPATDLTGYATEAYVMGKGFLTEHQSLSGYATEAYVTSKIEDVVGVAPAALDTLQELAYALNDDADFAGTMTSALAAKANSSDVYTKQEIDNAGYLTSHQSLADYVTKTDLSNAGYLTSHQSLADYALKSELPVVPSLEGYATEAYVMSQGFLTSHQDISGLATKAEIESAGYLTSHQSLADYATKAEISAAGYLTSHQDLSDYALKSELPVVPSLNGYATESYVANYVSTYAPAPDMSAYVSKTDLSNCGYITASSIPAQVKSDWEQDTSSNAAYILNKPLVVGKGNMKSVLDITRIPNSNIISNESAEGIVAGHYNKTGSGQGIVAVGIYAYAMGVLSQAFGIGTETNNYCESAFGKWNQSNTKVQNLGNVATIHSIGIGEQGTNQYNHKRKNAIEIMDNGDFYAYGVGNYDGTNYPQARTVAYEINYISYQIGDIETVLDSILGVSNS